MSKLSFLSRMLTLILLVTAQLGFGQEYRISGNIREDATGESLFGASV